MMNQMTSEMIKPGIRLIGLRAAHRVVRPDDSEDVVQDAFVSLLSTSSPWRGENEFASFFYSVVARQGLQKLRYDRQLKRSAKATVNLDHALRVSGGQTPEQILSANEFRDRLLDAIIEMTPGRRAAILAYLQDCDESTAQEIADRMGMALSAFKAQLHRARRELMEFLQD